MMLGVAIGLFVGGSAGVLLGSWLTAASEEDAWYRGFAEGSRSAMKKVRRSRPKQIRLEDYGVGSDRPRGA